MRVPRRGRVRRRARLRPGAVQGASATVVVVVVVLVVVVVEIFLQPHVLLTQRCLKVIFYVATPLQKHNLIIDKNA